jgi:hypothetical protein
MERRGRQGLVGPEMPDAASYCFERTEKGVRSEAVGYSFIFHAVLLVGEVQRF